jgi:hypothetical protein
MKNVLFIILVNFLNVIGYTQANIKLDWQAFWIGESFASTPNTFYKYRYQFTLNNTPDKCIASISCDSKYWLYINEKLVVFEGQLKRGPTPTDTYYDEVDIAPFLQEGKNTIAILMWYWGKQGFCHNSSGRAGLLFEAHINNQQKILSNESWKIAKHLAYGTATGVSPNYRLPEFNIHYDARYDTEDWLKNSYNDIAWTNAHIIAKAGEAPWNKLWNRPIPQWYNSGLVNYTTLVKNDSNNVVIAHLPLNTTMTPYFKIDAPAGLLIDIRTDNYMGGSEPNIRTEYVTKNGIQEYETPAYMNGHYIIYKFPPQVKILDLKYRETKYNTNYISYFNASDSFLNKLRDKSLNTLNVNMRDAIQDPDRERAQWWGDVVIILEEIFYSCDVNGQLAIKKAISNLLEWQKNDGVLFSPIPAGNWNKELPAQMLAAIGKYGIWKYIEHSGDTAMIRYAYPFIKKYLQLYTFNSNGLVNHRAGGWDWHDWGNKIDTVVLDNAWFFMAIETAFKMAKHLNLYNEAAEWQQKMNTIKFGFQNHFWQHNKFASKNYKYYADDRANGLAVCAGLVNKEQWLQLKPMLDTTYYAGPYLEKYILEAYFIMNDAVAGIERMKKRYASMVNHPTITTLWEGWEIGSNTYGGGTYNHGWSGGPLSLMSAYIAGIQPTNYGYKSFIIKPQPANLNYINAKVATPYGTISLQYKKNDTEIDFYIETNDANGTIVIPKYNKHSKIIIKNRAAKISSQDNSYWYISTSKRQILKIKTIN